MALTEFQRTVCRIVARRRIESGVSYVAGGTALNAATGSLRISRDIDVFHDAARAVAASWEADREVLQTQGFRVNIQRARDGFVEATIVGADESVVMQWTADSAFRFFPLVEHEDFGLTLHPFDLATNKVLALVGRLEARDWVDIVYCHERIQRLGYLVWAAAGKDPGFSPAMILEQAGRSARYSRAEIEALSFAGPTPDAAELAERWHAMLGEAHELVRALPPVDVGKCVLDERGELYTGTLHELHEALAGDSLRFHEARIGGALPQVLDP